MKLNLRTSIGSDIKWGLGWGLWLAAGFSILGSALFLLQGPVFGHASGFSFPLLIVGYVAMGLIGGLLAGVVRPLARTRIGATIIGVIIGIFVYSIAMIIAVGQKKFLSPPGLASALVLGTVIGGLFAHNMWTRPRDRRQ
jgi:hypothetical protein